MKLNVAVYRFVDLDRLEELQTRIDAAGRALGLRGTVLLAPEGINLFASGDADAITTFLAQLAEDERLRDLPVKRSWSHTVAFDRWRVRVNKEIVTLRPPDIRPDASDATRPPGIPWFDPLPPRGRARRRNGH